MGLDQHSFDQHSRHGSFLISAAALLARWVTAGLGHSWKIDVVAGREHLDALLAERRPAILSCWHNRTVAFSYFAYRRLRRRGLELTVLASDSRDGELATRVCERWGLDVIRGSASRGGRAALWALRRAVTLRRSSPFLAPDGPRGPRYRFKVGAAALAQASGAPVVLFGIGASRRWTLGSWDELIVPRPFSKVAIAVSAPQPIARDLSSEELERERRRLEILLGSLTRQAEEAVAATGRETVAAKTRQPIERSRQRAWKV